VLIAGGGVAALEATLALRALAAGVADIELLAPEDEFTYRPLSIAGVFRRAETARFPLGQLADEAGATLAKGTLRELDADRRYAITTDGDEIEYDACLLALGAVARPAVPGAITFTGPADEAVLGAAVDEAAAGAVRSLAFALPSSVGWPLPVYELALLAATQLEEAGASTEITLVTPEDTPLALFGAEVSEAIAELLELRGIDVRTGTVPLDFADGVLRVAPGDAIPADRVIAMPKLQGPRIEGVPADSDGFVAVDVHGRILGLDEVWAAGDMTAFPVKQGGIAAQQADAAAESIAARAGIELTPAPFRPVLRGLLFTGLAPRYLRGAERSEGSRVDTEPLWWPPTKIVGRHLSPFLATHFGTLAPAQPDSPALPVEVELDHAGSWSVV
jgi:sulfide:quinone oxidoreductase